MSEAPGPEYTAGDPLAQEGRDRAKRLLRDLRSSDPVRIRAAVQRLRKLRSFRDADRWSEHAMVERVRLKHALAAVAEELGYSSWSGLLAPPDDIVWYVPSMAFFVNRWFVDYDEARASRDAHGGYLLPHRGQYVVCDAEAIIELGLEPADDDWTRISHDVARPADRDAFARLVEKARRTRG